VNAISEAPLLEISSRKPLVIGISSRALLDLEKENSVYERNLEVSRAAAIEAFIQYQHDHRDDVIPKGIAFPLVRALLDLNKSLSQPDAERAIEVVIISRNHPDCGKRILRSLKHHGLEIYQAAFTGGEPVLAALHMYGVDLFLSYEEGDVLDAVKAGISAAKIFGGPADPTEYDPTPLLAFDGDSTLFSDESDRAYLAGKMKGFKEHEELKAGIPLPEGPMARFVHALALIHGAGPIDNPPIRIALVTSRDFYLTGRPLDTLRMWGIQLDQCYAVSRMKKARILKHLKPLMFFDNDPKHCADAAVCAPTAYVINPGEVTTTANGSPHAPIQAPLIAANAEPKRNFLLVCRSYLNLKNGSGDIAVLEQWFHQRIAHREAATVNAFISELQTSIEGTPAGKERPAKGAKNEKIQRLLSFLDALERKHFG
jgi:5'-nucleotidase